MRCNSPESLALSELEEQGKVAFQVLGDQEIFLYVLVTAFAEASGDIRMGEQEANLVGGALDGMGEQAGVFVDDLGGDSSNGEGDDGFLFPKSFGNG